MMQAAVEARNISGAVQNRQEMEEAFGSSITPMSGDKSAFLIELERAMIAAKVCAYVQGFEVLGRASDHFDWNLDLAAIARVWRAGCIIRSVFLDEISDVFTEGKHKNLSLAPVFRNRLDDNIPDLRSVVGKSVANGLQTPALYAALSYHNMRRNGRSTANMIQGLRDYFGAHTFERIDDVGTAVNGPWHS
jgi:6-phosphogluconate dehydrogenase